MSGAGTPGLPGSPPDDSPEYRAYRRDLEALPAEIRETVIRLEKYRARRR